MTEKLQNHQAEDQMIWTVQKMFSLTSNRLVLFYQHDNGRYSSADSHSFCRICLNVSKRYRSMQPRNNLLHLICKSGPSTPQHQLHRHMVGFNLDHELFLSFFRPDHPDKSRSRTQIYPGWITSVFPTCPLIMQLFYIQMNVNVLWSVLTFYSFFSLQLPVLLL